MRLFIVLFLVLTVSLFSVGFSQRTCLPGTFRNGKKCSTCPPGTFSDNFNRIRCRRCSPGTFRAAEGAASEDQCIPCPEGTFNDKEGASKCTKCPPGEDSTAGATACGFCPAGSALSRSGCNKCIRAFFSDKPGSRFCKRCPDGTFTGGGNQAFPSKGFGAKSCTKCPPGTFRRNSEFDFNPVSVFLSNVCQSCQPGTYSGKPGAKSCKLCPPGTFSGKGARKCTPCRSGTFNDRIPATSCRSCPKGTATTDPGASACKNPDRGCTFDTFEGTDGNCKACMPGERFDVAGKKCVPCGPNEVSKGGVDTKCKRCPAQQVPLGDLTVLEKSDCECAPGLINNGTENVCTACAIGTFWENGNSFFLTTDGFKRTPADEKAIEGECTKCPVGTFSDKPGMLYCKTCPVNTFQDVEGGSECMKCPAGSRSLRLSGDSSDTAREICIVEETACEAGQVRNRAGKCEDVLCPSKNSFFGEDGCTSCSSGFRAAGRKGCVRCKKNESSSGGASTTCTKCPKGKVSSSFGDSRCECPFQRTELVGRCVSQCPAGFGSEDVNSIFSGTTEKCVKCPPRKFSRGDGERPVACLDCRTRAISPDGTKCVSCPKGQAPEKDIFGRKLNRCRSSNPYF